MFGVNSSAAAFIVCGRFDLAGTNSDACALRLLVTSPAEVGTNSSAHKFQPVDDSDTSEAVSDALVPFTRSAHERVAVDEAVVMVIDLCFGKISVG